jgi:cbb3-type cytochrome oxidase maturation protein
MEILYLMIICSVSLGMIFLGIFIYGAKKGQFEDDQTPAIKMLLDNELQKPQQTDLELDKQASSSQKNNN